MRATTYQEKEVKERKSQLNYAARAFMAKARQTGGRLQANPNGGEPKKTKESGFSSKVAGAKEEILGT